MKILHFATMDYSGAGLATLKFHNALQKHKITSYVIVKSKKSNEKNVIEIKTKNPITSFFNRVKRWVYKLGHKVGNNYFFPAVNNQSRTYIETKKILKLLPYNPDAIVLHWIVGFVNYKNIYELHKVTGAKIFIITHDNEPFTGGCHFTWTCEKYQQNCTDCPALLKNPVLAANNFKIKKKYIDLINPVLLTGSYQDRQKIKLSALYKNHKLEILDAIVDKDVFYYKENANSQEKKENIKLLFATQNINDYRKGFDFFIKALEILKFDYEISGIEIFIAGKINKEIILPFKTRYLGFLNGDKEMVQAIHSVDCVVNTSIEDSGPYLLFLSLMCGRPIVSFDIGSTHDVIDHKSNGYIASNKDSNDLAKGLKFIYENRSALQNMNKYSREKALLKYSEEVVIKKFIHLLNSN